MARRRISIDWSKAALYDLDRFTTFLQDTNPKLAATIADAVVKKVGTLAQVPLMGRPVGHDWRQVVLLVAGAS